MANSNLAPQEDEPEFNQRGPYDKGFYYKHDELEDKERSANEDEGSYTPTDNVKGTSKSGSNRQSSGLSSAASMGAGLFVPEAGGAKLAMKALKFFWGNKKRKRSTLIGGGIVGGIIALLIGGFGFISSYALITIEKDVVHEEAKIEQHFEQKASQEVAKQLVCRGVPAGSAACPKASEDDTKPDNVAEDEAAAEVEGETEGLREDMDKFSFTDPQVEQQLSNQGIKVNVDPATGDFTGLTDDRTGKLITADDIATDGELSDRFSTALPEVDVGILDTYRPDMVSDAGVSFEGLPEPPTDKEDAQQEVQDEMETDIDQGATSEDLTEAEGSVSDQAPTDTSSSTFNTDTQAYDASLKDGGGKLGDAINATDAAEQAGESGTAAVEAGEKEFGSLNKAFIASLAVTACTLKNSVSSAALERVPEIAMLLMRHGNLLLTLADQLKTGNITGQQFGSVMSELEGSSGTTSKNGAAAESSLPFSSSEAWFMDTGQPVTNTTNPSAPDYTPGISKSAVPSPNGATEILDEINNIPGMNLVSFGCHALTGFFGVIIQSVLGLGQIVAELSQCATVVDCGQAVLEQVGTYETIASAQKVLDSTVLPDILKYFTPVGINGSEDAVQWLNNSDAGVNLSYNDYSRHLGASPVSSSTATSIATSADKEEAAYEKQQPLTYRLFSLSNPDSLVSRLALSLPTNLTSTFSKVASYFSNFPTLLMHAFSAIFLNKAYADSGQESQPWVAYQTQEYAFTDQGATEYDPLANEQYLFGNVTYTTGGETYSYQRIKALGNPDNPDGSVVAPNTDNNPNDFLHCFNLGFDTLMTTPQDQQNCHSCPLNNLSCSGEQNGQYVGIGQVSSDVYVPANGGNAGKVDINNQATDDAIVQSALPNDTTIANIYCSDMGFSNSSQCVSALINSGQVNNDVAHYEQYILDTNVMSNYLALTQSD